VIRDHQQTRIIGWRWAPIVFLASLTIGQCLVFQRLLFRDRPEYEFVLASISGVLSGYPVSKSWQHRFLGPWLVRALDALTHDRLGSLELFTWLSFLLANLVLYALLRRRGASALRSCGAVTCFVLVHALYAYRLEYAWDGIDALLFMSFGFWVARGGNLLALTPLLVIGTVNHETALYLPFWYVLTAIPWPAARGKPVSLQTRVRSVLGAGFALAAMAGAIWFLRERYYLGNPHLPGQTLEEQTPVLSNHLHVAHNLNQLIFADWRAGRARISATLWLGLLWLGREIVMRRRHAPAALWTLCVFVSIVCFGYVNETRHYLLLMAFWFAYGWPLPREESIQTAEPVVGR
jgi:hypothetical protein